MTYENRVTEVRSVQDEPERGLRIFTQKAAELRDQTTSTVENTVAQVQSKAGQLKSDLGEKATNLKQQGQDVLVEQLSAATKKIQGK